ncbi:precorrin-2 dehydrogenase/sirohydrochlorin ferrochelatase family protein [Nitrospina watsonii]|uniref:precorrin-2 dehydrogenase n=1 Tax=Nitrospina watsonii TaxID=1323948 RepID=A0ABM9HDZ9_9BACT|nr:NAD(P)-dependent oxidoreductase [Nitrospina watsonii]CAI2718288.1 Precorrin-2 dehydrogenase [Nitrospina watsonii]
MLIDLNLKGKQVVVVGGGREATGKVELLLHQHCQVAVVADRISDSIHQWEREKKLTCTTMIVQNGDFLKDYENLILVMAITDSRDLNRTLVMAGLKLGCYVYAVDDPEVSDFSHPSVIALDANVQVAISTNGKSPLMARTFRQRLEPILRQNITRIDLLQVRLQARMRELAKEQLKDIAERKKFLQDIMVNPEIQSFLERGNLQEAEYFACQQLKKLSK